MPVRLDLLSRKELDGTHVPLLLVMDKIDEDPDQPRREFDPESLAELAETIKDRGVRQPVSVRPNLEQPGRFVLNFGARRLRASKLAGETEIPAFVDIPVDAYDQVIENEQREGLKPFELAEFVKRRLELGESQTEIARLLGKSQPYVAYICALVDAPPWLVRVYEEGKCRGFAELYQLRRLHAQAPRQVQEWIEQRETITRTDLQHLKAALAQAADAVQPVSAAGDQVVAAAEPPQATGLGDSKPAPAPGNSTAPSEWSVATERANPVPGLPGAVVATPAIPKAAGAVTPFGVVSLLPDAGDAACARKAKRGLFAKTGEHVVEIVLDSVPDADGEVFVRTGRAAAPWRVSAASLALLGFLPVSET
jgi:ParB family chromosome partitioning protein